MEEDKYCHETYRPTDYCVKCKKVDHKPIEEFGKRRCHECRTPLRTRGVGLALSGGGYRATLFHIGGLWRLNELGWLKKLTEVTSVSGGSITAGWLGLQWKRLKFDKNGVATNFVEEVVNPLRKFCSHNIQVEGFFCGLARPYRRLFGKATLQDLPSDKEGPRFTIYATSLQTGVSVRMSKPYLADYNLGCVENPKIELAKVVAASSAFPLAMAPVILKFKLSEWKDWKPREGEPRKEIPDKEKLRKTMLLTDGGVYDNLGMERIFDRYSTVLASDAGAPFSTKSGTFWRGWNRVCIIKQSIDIITEQTRRLRRRWTMTNYTDDEAEGTLWKIDTKIAEYELVKEGLPPPLLDDSYQENYDKKKRKKKKKLSEVSTCLKNLGEKTEEALINWSYALTDAGMRRWVLEPGAKPGRLPYPK
jgi:NTE family protein